MALTILKDSGKEGKWSLSRITLMLGFSIVLFMWIVTIVVIFATDRTWDQFSGALDWGRNFFAVTCAPYLGNVLGAGIGKIGSPTK